MNRCNHRHHTLDLFIGRNAYRSGPGALSANVNHVSAVGHHVLNGVQGRINGSLSATAVERVGGGIHNAHDTWG